MDDKWFKAQQKRIGVTAEDIARQMGRARSNVSHILSGKQRMSLPWAKAFAEVLQVDVATVLEKAGVADPGTTQQLRPGFAESDATPYTAAANDASAARRIAQALGADRPGVDHWTMRSAAMALGGVLPGDHMLVDSHASERCAPGDTVVAQIYQRNNATTVIRRYEPPVLIAASCDPGDHRVHVVDGRNVVIRGKVIASWRA